MYIFNFIKIMKTTNSQLNCYLIEKTIGKGTFGKVKKAIHKYTQQPVAIKILEKSKIKDITDVERVSRELHILKLVRHSSIAQLYEIVQSPDKIFIVMEYAENGEFFDYIMDGKVKSEAEAHFYLSQILSGLEYMHKLGIAHRDIKPENILLDVHNRLKIVDFGLSNMYKKGQVLSTACGSPCYASPEMIKGEQYNPELTDVWSLGIVLFTMIMAKLPFQDDNTSILYSKIKSGLYIIDKKVSPQFKDLLSKLINIKTENRIKIAQIKNHPWFIKFSHYSSFGINVGFQNIPIDESIVSVMQNFNYPPNQTRRFLQYNVKNECTTTYYLFLKKNFKSGSPSSADICSQQFDENLIRRIVKNKRSKSIDFNALIQKSEHNDRGIKIKQRKCFSQIKPMPLDGNSINRYSSEITDDDDHYASMKIQFRKSNHNNSSTKSKDSKKYDAYVMHQRNFSNKKARESDQSSYKSVINRMMRQNRRLQTQNVKEIYSKDIREGVKKQLDVSEMFWKKKNSNNTTKGKSRYIVNNHLVSSKKALKNNFY